MSPVFRTPQPAPFYRLQISVTLELKTDRCERLLEQRCPQILYLSHAASIPLGRTL